MKESLSRRKFLQVSSAAAWAAGMVPLSMRSGVRPARGPYRGTFCFFSKVVPQMNWQDLAKSAKAAGFAGIDLTVRGGGHVEPQSAAEDLPKAVAAIRAEGLEVPMITTNLLSAEHPTAVPILSTASKLSIPFLKPGYYRYKFVDLRKEAGGMPAINSAGWWSWRRNTACRWGFTIDDSISSGRKPGISPG